MLVYNSAESFVRIESKEIPLWNSRIAFCYSFGMGKIVMCCQTEGIYVFHTNMFNEELCWNSYGVSRELQYNPHGVRLGIHICMIGEMT